jgi:SET domain-containing protein
VAGIEPRSRLAPGIEVRPSPIEGAGLFADRPFAAGEVVVVLGGRVVDEAAWVAAAAGGTVSGYAVAEDRHLVQEADDPARFGNHSCDPTTWLVDEVTLVARRAIDAGEELTVDYATLTGHPAWRLSCRCGSPSCRGAVTGRDIEQPELRVRYAGHVVPFLEQRWR